MTKANALSASPMPGPWRLNGRQILGPKLECAYPDRTPSEVIALLPAGEPRTGEYSSYPKAVAEANAQLIVKAPEMFRLLCEILGAAQVDGLEDKSNVWRSLLLTAEELVESLEPTPP
jgi:hypothetical protein